MFEHFIKSNLICFDDRTVFALCQETKKLDYLLKIKFEITVGIYFFKLTILRFFTEKKTVFLFYYLFFISRKKIQFKIYINVKILVNHDNFIK